MVRKARELKVGRAGSVERGVSVKGGKVSGGEYLRLFAILFEKVV